MPTKIYGLYDEYDNIRYVGKTTASLETRLKFHIYDSKKTDYYSHKRFWIRSMIDNSVLPVAKLLAEIDASDDIVNLNETFYIIMFRNLGANLTNTTDGGEGGFTSDMVRKAWETKRAKGTDTLSVAKMIETKKANGSFISGAVKAMRTRKEKGIPFFGNPSFSDRSERVKKSIAERRAKGMQIGANSEQAKRGAETCRRNGNKLSQLKKAWETRRKNGTANWKWKKAEGDN